MVGHLLNVYILYLYIAIHILIPYFSYTYINGSLCVGPLEYCRAWSEAGQ